MATPNLNKLKRYVELRRKIEKFTPLKQFTTEELSQLYEIEELRSWEKELRKLAEEVCAADLHPEQRRELLEEVSVMLKNLNQTIATEELGGRMGFQEDRILEALKENVEEFLKEINSLIGDLEAKGNPSFVLAKEEVEKLLHKCIANDGRLTTIEDLCAKLPGGCDNISLRECRKIFNDLKEFLNQSLTSKKPLTVADVLKFLYPLRAHAQCILPQPRPSLQPLGVIVEVGGESVSVEPPFLIGRFDPNTEMGDFPSDVLAIKKEEKQKPIVIYGFRSTKCKWGCIPPDLDCTSRKHISVSARGDTIIIEQISSSAKTWVGDRIGENTLTRLELRPGQQVKLWLSGVYSASGRERIPVIIRYGTASRPTVQPR